jgi:ABC-type transport system involved in Fe-S cluster assembly fused permease/ATPase subunit
MRYDSVFKNSSEADFYYSILEKYGVPDSVFEKSFVFYASTPKNFEKMYRKVMNKLSEKEQQYSGRKNELLEFEDDAKKLMK